MPDGAEVIYRGRNTLYRLRMGDSAVIVKEFGRPNAVNAFVYTTLRRSKARRSYENAERMRGLGFESPEPIAWGETREGLKLTGSCYICAELKGATEMRHWE